MTSGIGSPFRTGKSSGDGRSGSLAAATGWVALKTAVMMITPQAVVKSTASLDERLQHMPKLRN
jgi:hypothetical protein